MHLEVLPILWTRLLPAQMNSVTASKFLQEAGRAPQGIGFNGSVQTT